MARGQMRQPKEKKKPKQDKEKKKGTSAYAHAYHAQASNNPQERDKAAQKVSDCYATRMGLFTNSKIDDGSRFLEEIDEAIDRDDLMAFSKEFGFNEPNFFPFGKIVKVLEKHQFPSTELVEYGWAIVECGANRVETYSKFVRLFLSSLYLYTDKVEPFGNQEENEFLYLLLKDAIENGHEMYAPLLLLWLEWMYEHVPSGKEYDDYYLLLTWVLLKIHRREAADPVFSKVVFKLKDKNYSAEDIELNNVSMTVQPEHWLALARTLPPVPGLEEEVLARIISGSDAVVLRPKR